MVGEGVEVSETGPVKHRNASNVVSFHRSTDGAPEKIFGRRRLAPVEVGSNSNVVLDNLRSRLNELFSSSRASSGQQFAVYTDADQSVLKVGEVAESSLLIRIDSSDQNYVVETSGIGPSTLIRVGNEAMLFDLLLESTARSVIGIASQTICPAIDLIVQQYLRGVDDSINLLKPERCNQDRRSSVEALKGSLQTLREDLLGIKLIVDRMGSLCGGARNV